MRHMLGIFGVCWEPPRHHTAVIPVRSVRSSDSRAGRRAHRQGSGANLQLGYPGPLEGGAGSKHRAHEAVSSCLVSPSLSQNARRGSRKMSDERAGACLIPRDQIRGRLQQRLVKVDLLIVDARGFVPFERTGGALLLNILAERHGQRSTVITSHLACGAWVQVLGDEQLTTALRDRLGHRSHILTTKGPSYRTKRPTKEGRGKTAAA